MSTNPDPDLMRIFDFTPADLEANRAGKISAAQVLRLQNIVKVQQEDMGCLTFLLLPLIILLSCVTIQEFTMGDRAHSIVIIIILTLIIGGQLFGMYFDKHPAADDIVRSQLESAEGQMQLITKKIPYRARHIDEEYLRVNTVDIPIKKGTRKLLEQFLASKGINPVCRIYYVPKSRHIISVEMLE